MARATSTTRPAGPDDAVLLAMAGVIDTARDAREYLDRAVSRANEVRESRSRGLTYADIVTGTDGPLVIELVSDLIESLTYAGSRLRRAEARALYAEGLTMEKIGLLLRVSRQKAS